MARERYVKEGPRKEHYGLFLKKNKEIDERRKSLAYAQGSTRSKRIRLSSDVKREGGRVSWEREADDDTVIPYTSAEHEKLRAREEKVAGEMRDIKEKYGVRGIDELTYAGEIDDFFKGRAHFKIGYTADGHLYLERLKEGTSGRVYGLFEANGVLRNLERYANNIKKIEDFKKRHGRKSKLEATASAVTAILGIGLGVLFLSSNITGQVIAESYSLGSNVLGVILFVVGVIGTFFYFRKKK